MVIKTKQANAKHIFNQWWQCAVLLITEQTCYDSNVLRGFWIRFSSNQFFFSFAFVLFVSHRLCFYSWFDFFFRCSLPALTTANTLSTIYLICWYERFDLIWIEHLHFCFFFFIIIIVIFIFYFIFTNQLVWLSSNKWLYNNLSVCFFSVVVSLHRVECRKEKLNRRFTKCK